MRMISRFSAVPGIGIVFILFGAFALLPSTASGSYYFSVDEIPGDSFYPFEMVHFTVDTNYSHVLEFAIGQNDAVYASIDFDATSPPPPEWGGCIAHRGSDDLWYYEPEGYEGDEELWWLNLNEPASFQDLETAFVFTSAQPGEYNGQPTTFYTPLDPGFTNGFFGRTLEYSTPFAGFRLGEEGEELPNGYAVFDGETNIVPLPGAIWMLLPVLLGLIGSRRISRRRFREL